jgi:hypothetical protein
LASIYFVLSDENKRNVTALNKIIIPEIFHRITYHVVLAKLK